MRMKIISAVVAVIGTLVLSASAHADQLDTVKKSGELSFALSGAFPPFSYVDEQNNVVGFDVDVGEEIARRLGVKAKVVTTAWDGIIAGLLAGKYDTIIGSMSITPERQKAVDFAGPYYRGGRGVFVPDDSSVQTLDDLKGKTLGVTLGETSEKWARERGGWDLRTYRGLPELLLEIQAGRVDAIVTDDIPVLIAIKKQGIKIRQLDIAELKGIDNVGIALRKDSPELLAAINKALDDMKADGTYENIAKKWIGRDIR
jgi:ABC-type amino acid transport substrate-binding protein